MATRVSADPGNGNFTVTSSIFSFSNTGFTIDGIQRCDERRLRALLIPQSPLSGKDKRLITKRWATSQLQHYQLPVRKGTKDALLLALRTAVESGRCSAIPAAIRAIKTRLASEHAALVAAETLRRNAELQAAFDRITDPSEAASKDLTLFFKRHFLGPDGKLDLDKAPKALALPGFADRHTLQNAAEKISGLHTQSGGSDSRGSGRERVIVVGSDRSAVFAEAARFSAEHYKAEREEKEEQNKVKMQRHLDYASNRKGAGFPTGRYIVFCEEIESQWPSLCRGGFSLVIYNDRERKHKQKSEEALAGTFNWGVLAGVMRFRAEGQGWNDFEPGNSEDYSDESEDEGSEDEEPDDEESEEEHDSDHEDAGSNPKKRNHPSHNRGSVKNAGTGTNKKKIDRLKLHFQWRGRDTSEGMIYNGSSQMGTIRFPNKNFLKFEGEGALSFVGINVKFTGFKVSGIVGPMHRSGWSDFSDEVYERERVGRWH